MLSLKSRYPHIHFVPLVYTRYYCTNIVVNNYTDIIIVSYCKSEHSFYHIYIETLQLKIVFAGRVFSDRFRLHRNIIINELLISDKEG